MPSNAGAGLIFYQPRVFKSADSFKSLRIGRALSKRKQKFREFTRLP